MKRLFIILLVFAISISAQSIKDGSNSSTTTLNSSAVFTGTVRDVTRYSSISMTVFASDSSATNGLQVQFGDYITGTFTPMRYYFFTYNSPDSMFTKTLPVSHPYYRVLYTNDTDSLTSFYLVTMLNTGDKLPTTTDGKLDVNISSSALPSGAATTTEQDSAQALLNAIKLRAWDIKISKFPNNQTYADIRDSWEWVRSITTVIDSVRNDSLTVVRSRDTVLIGGTEWSKITIRGLASSDSLEVGIGTVAPSTWMRIIGTTPYVSEKLNKTYFTKVFIKGYGYKDVIKQYQLVIEAF